MSTETDEALMQAYCAGNAQAFDALYQRHRGPLYRYVCRQCQRASADEIFQDIWLKIVKARTGYHATAKFTTYLYTIARRRLIDHYRSQGNIDTAVYDESEDEDTDTVSVAGPLQAQPENQAANAQVLDQLLEEIERLPQAQREAFLLQEEAGLSLVEIAATLDVGVETVKSRIRYAIDKLRKRLVEHA
jgi:RNA polymerase sigma-70 factor (ECF subfamily)